MMSCCSGCSEGHTELRIKPLLRWYSMDKQFSPLWRSFSPIGRSLFPPLLVLFSNKVSGYSRCDNSPFILIGSDISKTPISPVTRAHTAPQNHDGTVTVPSCIFYLAANPTFPNFTSYPQKWGKFFE